MRTTRKSFIFLDSSEQSRQSKEDGSTSKSPVSVAFTGPWHGSASKSASKVLSPGVVIVVVGIDVPFLEASLVQWRFQIDSFDHRNLGFLLVQKLGFGDHVWQVEVAPLVSSLIKGVSFGQNSLVHVFSFRNIAHDCLGLKRVFDFESVADVYSPIKSRGSPNTQRKEASKTLRMKAKKQEKNQSQLSLGFESTFESGWDESFVDQDSLSFQSLVVFRSDHWNNIVVPRQACSMLRIPEPFQRAFGLEFTKS